MATDDVRKGFLEAMLQWRSTVSIITKTITQDSILSNQQQLHNDNVAVAKFSNQRNIVAMAPPMRYSV